MDNRLIVVQSEGRKSFDLAFQLFFVNDIKATHYLDYPEKGLVFFWHEYAKAIKLPAPLNALQAANIAWTWLETKSDKEYLEWLDHDGSDGHGFKVYNEDWNKVAGLPFSILAVQPVWAWYGK